MGKRPHVYLEETRAAAARFAAEASSSAIRKAYRSDSREFETWCGTADGADDLASLAEAKLKPTIGRRKAGIAWKQDPWTAFWLAYSTAR